MNFDRRKFYRRIGRSRLQCGTKHKRIRLQYAYDVTQPLEESVG